MRVESHAFREAFLANSAPGFVLYLEEHEEAHSAPPPFVTQKYDDHHLCLFVFQSERSAEKERRIFPAAVKLCIKKIAVADIQVFLTRSRYGLATLVFLRDDLGSFAPLDTHVALAKKA